MQLPGAAPHEERSPRSCTHLVRGDEPSGPEDPGDSDLAVRLDALRSAIARDPDPKSRVAHEATLGLLDRGDRAAEGHYAEGWTRFADAANRLVGQDGWAVSVGVLANMIGVVHFAAPSDFVTASRLAKRYGHRKVASVQNTVYGSLGTGPEQPVATRWVLTLARTDLVIEKPAGLGDGEGRGRRGRRAVLPELLLVGHGRCRPVGARSHHQDRRGGRADLGPRRYACLARPDRDHRVQPVGAVRQRAEGARARRPIGRRPSTRSKRR